MLETCHIAFGGMLLCHDAIDPLTLSNTFGTVVSTFWCFAILFPQIVVIFHLFNLLPFQHFLLPLVNFIDGHIFPSYPLYNIQC